MESFASQIARRLADNAEAVCRRYLSQGRKEGRYWLVGDIRNTPGRSLYVRLAASPDGSGAAGKWNDAQNGDHGDLLDVIAGTCGYHTLREPLDEARRFLSLPMPSPNTPGLRPPGPKAPPGSTDAARRLWSASKPVRGTVASRYLRARGIGDCAGGDALRFHASCFYRASRDDVADVRSAWPAMIAAVTDLDGSLTGVHRTWLDPNSAGKASVAFPRRAMGHLLGNGVRFGRAGAIMLVGEGIETVLSLREMVPGMPVIAALSSAHLAAIVFPAGLRRLYVARDADPAGAAALKTLTARGAADGIEVVGLEPELGDFNDDLRKLGRERLMAALRGQLGREDARQFLKVG